MANQKELSRKYIFLNGSIITLKKFVVPHATFKMMLTVYTIHDYLNYNHNHYTDGEIVDCVIRRARYNGKYVTLFINRDDTISIADFIVDALVMYKGLVPTHKESKIISKIMDNKDECPKCHSKWVNDIGFDTMQCFDCDHTWKQKSKTGLENNK